MMSSKFKESMRNIKSNRPLISVQDIVTFIEKGEKYLKLDVLTEQEEIEILHGIVLSPDYQRKYRSSIREESSIIESLLIGIPIPEVFLVISGENDAQIRHVMDGQHRLNAIFRYINNKFPLKNLEIIGENPAYDNKKFSELDKKDKIKILGSHLSILEFESFEDPEVEIELFKRYNRNTKPLEIQEIEMATYFSETSKFISNFINSLIEDSEDNLFHFDNLREMKLLKLYNITKGRNDKQKNHQEICIIFSVLEKGLQENIRDGITASKVFLERKSKFFKKNEDEDLIEMRERFDDFNELIIKISNEVEFPFSMSMVSDKKERQSKFIVGVSIILAAIYYYFEINLNDKKLVDDIKTIISFSPIADIEYKASSTNMKNIMKYLFIDNKIQKREFSSLILKQSKKTEIENFIRSNIEKNIK
ncbi:MULTISPECIES: DUF262 domain-containing protein [Bacillus]|uniref:DUF262 domain-containing protein n=1 Tax=Bacillus TaxID=1386 RepID=UPI000A837955|nr:DUF262 domain-containing protein [Bacillus pumilus]MCY7678957.1 DUF262 domain-containing protein [Bacillus pumilus]